MSLRWTAYVAPSLSRVRRGSGSKTQNSRFRLKVHCSRKKVCYYKVYLCESSQRQSCKAFTGQNGRWGTSPSIWKFGRNWLIPFKHAYFQSIFACSASAATPSEKRSTNTNSKSTTSFPMSIKWTVYVAPKPKKGCSKTQKWPSFVQHLNNDLR